MGHDEDQEFDEEFDEELIERIDEAMVSKDSNVGLDFSRLDDKVGPAPLRVPKFFKLTPMEFMQTSVEYFNVLCESEGYPRVVSGLTYIQNIASNGNEEIKEKVKNLKAGLKELHTIGDLDGHNKYFSPPAHVDDVENPEATSGSPSQPSS